ncbi:hypothetical protein WMF38_57795 [Sorangium sp. So ce118]
MSIAAILDRAAARTREDQLDRGVSVAEVTAATGRRHGELGNLRGRSNERRVCDALASSPLPNWIVSWRPATRSEDAMGADLVFILAGDVRVWINVKSNAESARRYRAALRTRRVPAPLGTVVIRDSLTRDQIVERVLVTLAALRGFPIER